MCVLPLQAVFHVFFFLKRRNTVPAVLAALLTIFFFAVFCLVRFCFGGRCFALRLVVVAARRVQFGHEYALQEVCIANLQSKRVLECYPPR